MIHINKRIRIIKGRENGKFGIILEVNSDDFLIELNEGKILNFPKEEVEIIPDQKPDKEGKYDIKN